MLELMVIGSRPDFDGAYSDEFVSEMGEALTTPDKYRFNFSYVVDKATMLPVEPILQYLTFSASARSNSEITIKNKADNCYELFLYLDAINVNYRDICLQTLIEYKERLSSYISPKTRRPLGQGTIKMRLQVAREFCVYHGILPAADTIKVKGRLVAGHMPVTLTGPSAALNVKTSIGLIEYVNHEDLRRLMAGLGNAPGNETSRPSRDWLLAMFCVTTGVRLSEALGLTVNQILGADCSQSKGRSVIIRLTKTKRSKLRDISVDRGVIEMLIKYIDGERRDAVTAGLACRRKTRPTGALFVNGNDCAPRYAGLPYQAKRAEEYFAASQLKIGMTRIVPVYDPETRQLIGERAMCKHTMHHLRHTYAIHAWNAYRDLPEIDRWIRIQSQLGHKSHEITADTYLRAVKHLEGPSRDAMGSFYKSLMAAP